VAIKSALRVLQLLEHLDDEQRPLSALDVASAMGWPRSSAWGLLQTLVEAGYLSFDQVSKQYFLSERVPALGLWRFAPLFQEGKVLKLMHEIRAATKARVVLAAHNANTVRYIYAVQGEKSRDWVFRLGSPLQLLRTSVGRLYLSTYEEKDAARIAYHLRDQRREGERIVPVKQILEELREVRRQGYSLSLDRLGTGDGAISMLLPRAKGQQRPLAIGLVCSKEELVARKERLVALMRRKVRQHLGHLRG